MSTFQTVHWIYFVTKLYKTFAGLQNPEIICNSWVLWKLAKPNKSNKTIKTKVYQIVLFWLLDPNNTMWWTKQKFNKMYRSSNNTVWWTFVLFDLFRLANFNKTQITSIDFKPNLTSIVAYETIPSNNNLQILDCGTINKTLVFHLSRYCLSALKYSG